MRQWMLLAIVVFFGASTALAQVENEPSGTNASGTDASGTDASGADGTDAGGNTPAESTSQTPEATPGENPENNAQPQNSNEPETAPPSNPTPDPSPASSSQPQPDSASARGEKKYGFMPKDLAIGPTVQVGVPHLVNYGLDILWKDIVSVGFATGKFERDFDDVKVQLANWDFKLRWHPFASSFFVGAAYGQQKLAAEMAEDLELKSNGLTLNIPTEMQVVIETTYLTPQLGWLARWSSGFTLGFELGAQMAMSSKAEFDVGFENVAPSQEDDVKKTDKYKDLKKDIDDVGTQIGESTLPYLVLRLGWLL